MAGEQPPEGLPQAVLPGAPGVPLPHVRPGKERQTVPEAAPAVHTDHNGPKLARGRVGHGA